MKINILIILMILMNIFDSNAQTPQEMLKQRQEKMQEERRSYNEGLVDTSQRYFYRTYSDFLAKKPVKEIKFTGKRKILMGTETVLVAEDDDFVDKKIKELKFWGFIDEWGQLERIFDNHCYYVLDTGKICSYVKAVDVEMTSDKNGNISLNWLSENAAGYKDYISEGLTGPISDFNEKKFASLTASHPEVFEQFQKDESDNSAKEKRSAKTFKIQKYVDMFNKKEK